MPLSAHSPGYGKGEVYIDPASFATHEKPELPKSQITQEQKDARVSALQQIIEVLKAEKKQRGQSSEAFDFPIAQIEATIAELQGKKTAKTGLDRLEAYQKDPSVAQLVTSMLENAGIVELAKTLGSFGKRAA